jgi:hypothetical protein
MEDLTVILPVRHLTSQYTCDGEDLSPDLDIGKIDRSRTPGLLR